MPLASIGWISVGALSHETDSATRWTICWISKKTGIPLRRAKRISENHKYFFPAIHHLKPLKNFCGNSLSQSLVSPKRVHTLQHGRHALKAPYFCRIAE